MCGKFIAIEGDVGNNDVHFDDRRLMVLLCCLLMSHSKSNSYILYCSPNTLLSRHTKPRNNPCCENSMPREKLRIKSLREKLTVRKKEQFESEEDVKCFLLPVYYPGLVRFSERVTDWEKSTARIFCSVSYEISHHKKCVAS